MKKTSFDFAYFYITPIQIMILEINKIKNIFFCSLLCCLFFLSCNSDDDQDNAVDCSNVLCENSVVSLEFRDETTEEDLFLNGTLSVDDLEIVDTQTQEAVNFSTSSLNFVDGVFIAIPDPENAVEQNIEYRVSLEGAFDFLMRYEVTIVEDPCCSDFRFTNFVFEEVNFENGGVSQSSNGFVILL